MLKHFELLFIQLQLVKNSCKLLIIWVNCVKKQKGVFFYETPCISVGFLHALFVQILGSLNTISRRGGTSASFPRLKSKVLSVKHCIYYHIWITPTPQIPLLTLMLYKLIYLLNLWHRSSRLDIPPASQRQPIFLHNILLQFFVSRSESVIWVSRLPFFKVGYASVVIFQVLLHTIAYYIERSCVRMTFNSHSTRSSSSVLLSRQFPAMHRPIFPHMARTFSSSVIYLATELL